MRRILLVIVLLLLFTTVFAACGNDLEKEEPIPFLKTDGRKIVVSTTGAEFVPKGVNAGGWLSREGWMTPFSNNDELTGDSYYDRLMYETLVERFGQSKAYELEAVYLDNWWTEIDFDNIKAMGFNHIRLGFTYMNFYYLPDLTWRDDGFERMDWFVDECAERGLYVVLDMHGAFGSQNGQHHSGDTTQAALFTSEDNMKKTEELWVKIAEHYKSNPWILAYDLLNEPEGDLRKGNTDEREWNYFDRLYDAIRAVDANHIIMMEACWEISNLPKPTTYGWENVVYQIHVYNWDWIGLSTEEFWLAKKFTFIALDNYNVPMYVGEWNAFGEEADWTAALNVYEQYNIGWCVWTYKTTGGGSWSVYGGNSAGVVNIETDTEADIIQKWTATKTGVEGRYVKNDWLIDVLTPHLKEKATQNKDA
jgi:Endoglucanase